MSGTLAFCLLLLAALTYGALRLIVTVRTAGEEGKSRKSEQAAPVEVLW